MGSKGRGAARSQANHIELKQMVRTCAAMGQHASPRPCLHDIVTAARQQCDNAVTVI